METLLICSYSSVFIVDLYRVNPVSKHSVGGLVCHCVPSDLYKVPYGFGVGQ